jgi:diguanylate cyclase (GGDEF)-like protein
MKANPKSEPQLTEQSSIEPAPNDGNTVMVAQSRERLQETLKTYDDDGEIFIALGQIAIAGLILILHIVEQVTQGWQSIEINHHIVQEMHGWHPRNFWVIIALSVLSVSSLFRIYAVRHEMMAERLLDFLTFIDVATILLVIASYQLVYGHPSAGSLKSPSFVLLCVFIGIRALCFNPRPILVSGITAVTGWIFLILLSVVLDGTGAITGSYTEYLASFKILISAELEKIASLIALTGCLTISIRHVRTIIGKAAHGEDYAKALTLSERNMKKATLAHQEEQEALRRLAKREKQLRLQNEQFNAVLGNMSQGVAMFDKHRRLVICNNRYRKLYNLPSGLSKTGTPVEEIIDHKIKTGTYYDTPENYWNEWTAIPEEKKQITKINKMYDGRTISYVYVPLQDGGWLATHEDISELRQIQEDFYHLAHHDALTSLANRHMFGLQLEQILAQLRPGDRIAVHLIDLDYFKNVNDTLGHPIGDKLLKAVTERLRKEAGHSDVIARMGGDEFALIQFAGNQPADAEDLATRIIDSVSKPYTIDDHQIIIGASIGIAIGPDDGDQIETIMRNADLALYRAKENGRGAHRFFEAEMDAKMQTRRALELDMRVAIEKGGFELHYQPLVELKSGELCGFEALIRWPHPEKGNISPAEFIPLAEETGFMVQIGEWVIREACKTAASWPDHLIISVNLSPVQFRDNNLVQLVMNALASSGLPPSRLELEITESVLLEDNAATLNILRQLKQLGVRIIMDDFGTGYSSLSYLQSFPFDKIKIDKSFVEKLNNKGSALNIVRAVSAMAKGMGIETTAEGVETKQQLDVVRNEGYSQIQGFYISKPLPADEIKEKFFANLCVKPKATVQDEPKQTKRNIVIGG